VLLLERVALEEHDRPGNGEWQRPPMARFALQFPHRTRFLRGAAESFVMIRSGLMPGHNQSLAKANRETRPRLYRARGHRFFKAAWSCKS